VLLKTITNLLYLFTQAANSIKKKTLGNIQGNLRELKRVQTSTYEHHIMYQLVISFLLYKDIYLSDMYG